MDLRVLGFWHTRAMQYGPVRDGLFARAVMVRSEGETACLVALDLIGDAVAISTQVRNRITETLALTPEHVMVTCTHTHTSPESIALSGHGVAPQWIDFVAGRAAQAARQAAANLKPCRLTLAHAGLPGVAVNRAARDNAQGMECLSDDERARYAFLDETVRVATFRGEDGSMLGALFSFACHPVCVQAQGFISADWPGEALRMLEKHCPAVFVNGACGDADPVRMRRYEDLEWTGRQVAQAVERTWSGHSTMDRGYGGDDETIKAARRIVRPARRDVGRLQELERHERETDAAIAAAGANENEANALREALFDLREKLALAWLPAKLSGELQAIRIGPLVLVAMPGEVVACLGEDIRRALPRHEAWVVGYANGYLGYMVTKEGHRVGGYESSPGRWSPLAPGEAEKLRDEAIALSLEISDDAAQPGG